MQKHLEKVRAHAKEKLRSDKRKVRTRADLIKLYKRFLKIEEHRVRLMHNAGAGGAEVAKRRSDLLDVVLQNLLTEALAGIGEGASPTTPKQPITLVATGGYGRALLNPGSDVDLLFLNRASAAALPKETTEVIEQVLYMLWDTGFKVGHAVRSIRETIKLANSDHLTKSALIEARLITGDKTFFEELRTRFDKSCIATHGESYLQDRLLDLKSRHAKYLGTVYVQEPQVKNGCGGLRDYHNVRWVCYVRTGTLDLMRLVDDKTLSMQAYKAMEKAHDFLLRVRNELHYSEKRATDILTLRLQGVVSENIGYQEKNVLHRTEEFMRDYYTHTRSIFQHSTSLMERFQLEQEDSKSKGIISFLARRTEKVEHFDGFTAKGGRIYPENSKVFKEDSGRIMRLFQHLQQRHLDLSPQMRQLVKRNWALIDKAFRYRKTVRETFEAILSRKGDVARTLRAMHRAGVLGRYLPEFGALDCLVQHEFFHRYTADEHTLTCIDKLDELSDSGDPKIGFFQDLFHNLDDPYVLYLALIMHDTGRAANSHDHTDASTMLASRVCKRLAITMGRRRLLIFLVDHHLTFWRTATTKNLDDPNTISEFAGIVKTKHYLDTLFLLSYVDSKGTNEEAWSDWKEMLMRQLYSSTLLYLEDKGSFDERAQEGGEMLREAVFQMLEDDYREEIEAHFKNMPGYYFRLRDPASIADHIRDFRRFFQHATKVAATPDEALTPSIRWESHRGKGNSELVICGWDRANILSKIAGALAAHKINILSADIFVREDDVVLDIFHVCTTDFEPVTCGKTRQGVERLIADSCRGQKIDFSKAIEEATKSKNMGKGTPLPGSVDFPQRVFITNDASPEYTVVEIQALDRIGLLYDVIRTISGRGFNIFSARISTEKGAAIDRIYITDVKGAKIINHGALGDLGEALDAVLTCDM